MSVSFGEFDPELTAYFGNFERETIADAAKLSPNFDARLRTLVQLGACVASGGLGAYSDLAETALWQGLVTAVEVKEIAYQSVAYVGMASALDFVTFTNEILIAAGDEPLVEGQSKSTPETRFEYGLTVQGQIVGGAEAARQRITDAGADEQHFQRYLAENCFGDTVGRGGLTMPERELITFAMLSALGGADAQVKGHVAGNLAVGNSRADLLAVLTVLVPFIGYPRTLNALAAVNEVAPAGG